ncbi:MAG: hypothetical protein ACK5WZ_09200 [Pseudobdellovibrionaceae bacterium]
MKRSQILILVLAATLTSGASAFADQCRNHAEVSAANYVQIHRQTIQAIQSSLVTNAERELLLVSSRTAKDSIRQGVTGICQLIASQNFLTRFNSESYGLYGGQVFDQKVEELIK